jgi:DNA polymerase IIIc chi subunit
VGGFITNKLTGGEEEEAKQEVAAPAPVINITNSNQQQQAADRTIVINRSAPANAAPATKSAPAAKPVKTDTEKRKEEGLEW